MGALDLTAFTALSFDCYGTLIDWESGIDLALRPWLERHGRIADRGELLALFAASETRRQREAPWAPYPEILVGCFDDIAAGFALAADQAERLGFAQSIAGWPPFSDSAKALASDQTVFPELTVPDLASFVALHREQFAAAGR